MNFQHPNVDSQLQHPKFKQLAKLTREKEKLENREHSNPILMIASGMKFGIILTEIESIQAECN